MATFSNQLYNAARYAAARPTYPRQIFDLVVRFHESGHVDLDGRQNSLTDSGSNTPSTLDNEKPRKAARWSTAIDLGCGTGQATIELASSFKHIIGVDPSAKMLESAKKFIHSKAQNTMAGGINSDFEAQFAWIEGAVEKFEYPDESLDLVVSAQAAHWFDWKVLWPRLARMVKPGGTVAIWGYSFFRIPNHPEITPFINEYAQGTSREESLGPFWEQPGRQILDRLLVDVPRPSHVLQDENGAFGPSSEIYFTGEMIPESSTIEGSKTWIRPPILRTHCSWESLEAYLRTWSALDEFWINNPSDKENSGGDIVIRFINQLKNKLQNAEQSYDENDGVDIEWPMVLLMFKRL